MTPQEVYDAVWERDEMAAPDGSRTNPTWRASSVVTDTNKKVRALEDEVAEVKAELVAVRADLAEVLALLKAANP